jgi:hypothetical protein
MTTIAITPRNSRLLIRKLPPPFTTASRAPSAATTAACAHSSWLRESLTSPARAFRSPLLTPVTLSGDR